MKFENKLLPEALKNRMNTLTEMEKTYFQVMWAKYGVLNITSKPGVAKSAIGKSIADKMEFKYRDIRLTMVDETDVGLYPSVSEIELDGQMIKCLDFVVPRWAIEANKQPTIIHFEELNRASQQVRNAALQILLERQIGEFKFNDNVLMMSSGNLGDEDGTDVEEFDAALNNRLIHVSHSLSVESWLNDFATDNVHPFIAQFIELHPEHLYKTKEDAKAYSTPRSWTMLSEYIIANFGYESTPAEFLSNLRYIASCYIGNSAMRFLQYCDELLAVNIDDIINNFDGVKKDLAKFNRDKSTELIFSLKEKDLSKLNKKQLDNIIKFLETIGEDENAGYLLSILDSNVDVNSPNYERILLHFVDLLKNIRKINKPDGR